jgi:ABC-type transport system substrate-binding protein
MDALLDAQEAEQDQATRIGLLEQIQDFWVEQTPFAPLAQGSLAVAYRDNISNVILDPLGLFHYFLIEKG